MHSEMSPVDKVFVPSRGIRFLMMVVKEDTMTTNKFSSPLGVFVFQFANPVSADGTFKFSSPTGVFVFQSIALLTHEVSQDGFSSPLGVLVF